MTNVSTLLKLCRTLVCGVVDLPRYPDPPISAELAIDYAKRGAATELGDYGPSPLAEAALARAALTQNEDDRVRTEAVQQLLHVNSGAAEVVLLGLLFDSDDEMRLTAIEGLVLIRSSNLAIAAQVLDRDESATVRNTIARAMSGAVIDLYRLDPL